MSDTLQLVVDVPNTQAPRNSASISNIKKEAQTAKFVLLFFPAFVGSVNHYSDAESEVVLSGSGNDKG